MVDRTLPVGERRRYAVDDHPQAAHPELGARAEAAHREPLADGQVVPVLDLQPRQRLETIGQEDGVARPGDVGAELEPRHSVGRAHPRERRAEHLDPDRGNLDHRVGRWLLRGERGGGRRTERYPERYPDRERGSGEGRDG